MRRNRIVYFILSICVLTIAGCGRVVPYEEFESFTDLRDSFQNEASVRFPDVTEFNFKEKAKYTKDYVWKSDVVTGYNFGGFLENQNESTYLWDLYFSCVIKRAKFNKGAPAPDLRNDIQVSDINVQETVIDKTADQNLQSLHWYPDDANIISMNYQFDYNENRYSLSGTMAIPFRILVDQDENQIVTACQNEFIKLINSITEEDKDHD